MTNRVEEVGAGLNVFVNGKWVPSDPRLVLSPDLTEAFTDQLQYQCRISSSPADDVLFTIGLPGGKEISGRVFGLAYVDSQGAVLIADVLDVAGKIVGKDQNEVVFESAFNGVDADLFYRMERGRVSQNVLIKSQLPAPEAYGMEKDAVLVLYTEFLTHPEIKKESRLVRSPGADTADMVDEALDVGSMHFTPGRAFSVGQESQGVDVLKRVEVLDDRTFLLEQVPWKAIENRLAPLPALKEASIRPRTRKSMVAAIRARPRNKREQASARTSNALMTAQLDATPRVGCVLDFELALTTSSKTWKADTTYWISSAGISVATNVFENGAVIRMTNGAKLTITGPSTWPASGPPVVITSIGDLTHGEKVGTNSASGGYYANPALEVSYTQGPNNIRNLRILNATKGIKLAASTTNSLRHIQMVNVGTGIEAASGVAYKVQNALFHNVRTNFSGSGSTAHVEHLTVNTADWLSDNNTVTVKLTNSLLVAVGGGTNAMTGAGIVRSATTNGIFVAVGAGYHYPWTGYRVAGVNSIDPNLGADLVQMTIYPPTVLTANITNSLTLSQALPAYPANYWIGYHYPRMDYAISGLRITNAVLALAPGVSLGFYGDIGFTLDNAGQFSANGLPGPGKTALRHFRTVQEQPIYWGGTNSFDFFRVGSVGATPPAITLRFAEVAVMANAEYRRSFIYDSPVSLNISDSMMGPVETHSFANPNTVTWGFTNNWWHRGSVVVYQTYYGSSYFLGLGMRNNTFFGSALTLIYGSTYYGEWSIYDNLFSEATFDLTSGGPSAGQTPNGNNGYFSTTALPGGVGDVSLTTMDWQPGPFGDRYYPVATNGQNLATLIDKGSRLASSASLLHHTTTAAPGNVNLEGASQVDIGFHYPSVDANGLARDTDGDGYWDGLEDGNGNAVRDAGERDWFGVFVLTNRVPAYFVGGPSVALDPSGRIAGIDAIDYVGSRLTIDLIYSVFPNEDRLEILNQGTGPGQLGVTGAALTYGGNPFGSFQVLSNSTKLVVSFYNNYSVTPEAVAAVISSVAYKSLSLNPSFMNRTARFKFEDARFPAVAYGYKSIRVGCAPGLDVVFLIDRTGSLTPEGFTNGIGAAKTLLNTLDFSADQAAVISFCEGTITHSSLSSNKTSIAAALDSIQLLGPPCNNTAVDGALGAAQALLDSQRRTNAAQPIVLLISDGVDGYGYSTSNSGVSKSKGTRILSFGVGPADIEYLSSLASCQADYYPASSSNALAQALSTAASLLCRGGNVGPSISLVSPTNSSGFASPARVDLVASASDSDGFVTKVEYFSGSTKIAESLVAPFTSSWTVSTAGTYALSAVAIDNGGLRATSAVATINLAQPNARTYTRNVDFASAGPLLNVNFDEVADQLTINRKITPFPFLSVACTAAGYLARVDVNAGDILGAYYTAPFNKDRHPMAVTVDRLGNTWVANDTQELWMNDATNGPTYCTNGSVTCIGLVIGGTRGRLEVVATVTNFVPDATGEYLKGPFLYNTCIDRNGDGYIRTSCGLSNKIDWARGTNAATAADEAILCYVLTDPVRLHGVAVDANDDVWVAGKYPHVTNGIPMYQKIQGFRSPFPGIPFYSSAFTNDAGGSSMVIDGKGVLWSVTEYMDGGFRAYGSGILRRSFSPVLNQYLGSETGNPYTNGNAGLTLDPVTGDVWIAGSHENFFFRNRQQGNTVSNWLAAFNERTDTGLGSGSPNGCGIAVDQQGHVWIALNNKNISGQDDGPNFGAHFLTDGTFIGHFPTCHSGGGTGVSIDSNGKIWIVNDGAASPTAVRIDPGAGPRMLNNQLDTNGVPIGLQDLVVTFDTNSRPMSVGDMTGYIAVGVTAPSGMWSGVHDGGQSNATWGTLSWHPTTQPQDTSLIVQARAHNRDTGLTGSAWTTVSNGVPLSPSLTGRFLEFRVTFALANQTTNRPTLYDLTITPASSTAVSADNQASFAQDDYFSLFQNDQNVLLDALANDSDPAGGSLGIKRLSPPMFGTLTQVGNRLSYSPRPGFYGLDRCTYSATNSAGVESWGMVTLRVNKLPLNLPPPNAVDDYASVSGNSTAGVSIPVLSNDTNYTDIVYFQQGSLGTVQRSGGQNPECDGPNLTYTPQVGAIGYDRFTYTIANSQGVTRSATVWIHITGDPIRSIQCGDTLVGSISPSDRFIPTSNINRFDEFVFEGTNGASIAVNIVCNGATLSYSLINPDGELNLGNGNTHSLTQTGTHSIRVKGPTSPPAVPYTLSLVCAEAAPSGIPRLMVLAGELVVTNGASLHFGNLDQSALPGRWSLELTLVNTGQVVMEFSNVTDSDPFVWRGVPTYLDPGMSIKCYLDYQLTNTIASGFTNGINTFDTDDPGAGTFSLNLSASYSKASEQPLVSLLSPISATTYAPGNLTLQALVVTNGNYTVTQVVFYATELASLHVSEATYNAWSFSGLGAATLGIGTNDGNGTWSAPWNYVAEGSYRVIAVAFDTRGFTTPSSNAMANVSKPDPEGNHAPLARSDSFFIPANSTSNLLQVLANDQDPDHDTLSILSHTQPGFGTLVRNANSFYYSPPLGVIGTNGFTYEIVDERGARARAQVTLKVVAPPDGSMPPSIALTTPINGSATRLPTNLVINATTSTNTAWVEFFDGNEKIGTDLSSPFSISWTEGSPGMHTLWAIAYTADGLSAGSDPVTVKLIPKPLNSLPVGAISNLSPTNQANAPNWANLPILPIVREGILDVSGLATDRDAQDSITYKLRLLTTQGDRVREWPYSGRKSGPSDLLGTLDLTTVENGIYDLELAVSDGSDVTRTTARFILESQLKIGQFRFTEQDLVIPVSGIPLTILRTYDSQNLRSSDFGYSWSFAINDIQMNIDEDRRLAKELEYTDGRNLDLAGDSGDVFSMRSSGGRNVTLTLPTGRRATFQMVLTNFLGSSACPECYEAIWVPPPGVYATLRVPNPANRTSITADNAINPYGPGYPIWGRSGAHTPWENYDLPQFILSMPDGTDYEIERKTTGGSDHYFTFDESYRLLYVEPRTEGRLARIRQRTGDWISITNSRIDHFNASNQLTRSILLARDSLDRIIEVRDPVAGSSGLPVVKYEYDDKGNLIRVNKLTDRNQGLYAVTSYTYTNQAYPHFLTAIIDPRGIAIARSVYDQAGRLIQVYDANGYMTQLVHDTTNHTERIIDRLNTTNHLAHDLRGNILFQTNAQGLVTAFSYDALDQKVAETNALGVGGLETWTRFAYNSKGFITNVETALATNSYTVNSNGLTIASRDPRGILTLNEYDFARNLLLSVTNAAGSPEQSVTRFTYNTSGLLTSQRDALGNVTTNQYNSFGSLTNVQIRDAAGQIMSETAWQYDVNGVPTNQLSRRTFQAATQWLSSATVYDAQQRPVQNFDQAGGTRTTLYNIAGQVEQVIDPLNRTTTYQYGATGLQTNTIFADGSSESASFDAEGRVTNRWNRIGVSTSYRYDALGRQTHTIVSGVSTNQTVYDFLGRVAKTIDGRGVTNAFQYDTAGRRIAVTNAWGISGLQQVTRSYFDANGNLLTVTNANGQITDYSYDALNRLTQVWLPATVTGGGRPTRRTVFNNIGQRTQEIDESSITNSFGYDGAGRLTSVTNAWGTTNSLVARFAYDEVGNQTNQVDNLGRETKFEYDVMGRRIKRTLPGGALESFVFDPVGNLVSNTTFRSLVLTNQYDSMNRLLQRKSGTTVLESMAYDKQGRLTNRLDSAGVHNWIYDEAGRVRTNTTPAGRLLYTYDPNGNLLSLKTSSSSGADIAYAYDALNRLTNVVDNRLTGTKNTAYTWDGVGNMTGMQYPNGVTNTLAYDARNRLTNQVWKSTGNTLASFFYQIGGSGQQIRLDEVVYGTNRTHVWGYDTQNRLRSETVTGTSPTGTLTYQWDGVGNRSGRTGTLGSIGPTNATFDIRDQLDNDATPTTLSTLFDAAGNTTNSSGALLQWDWAHRLTNASSPAVQIVYDAEGNRVKKISSVATNLYLVDTRNPTGYAQVIEELSIVGGATNLTKVYTPGIRLISQRIIAGSVVSFYGTDGHGSVRFLTRTNGVVSDTYAFDAFGNLTAGTFATSNNFLYCGEQWDPELGRYFLRARYYEPGLGRFSSMDSFQGNQSDPLSLHKYLYCHDDPVNRIDPSGNFDVISTLFAGLNSVYLRGREAAGSAGAYIAAQRTITKIATIAVGATLTVMYAHNEFAGDSPNDQETQKISRAVGTMKQNGYVKHANRADSLRYRKVDLDGEAWGYNPWFSVRTIWLDPNAFLLDDLLFTSLVMHETDHTLQYPIKSEKRAYQVQSDFLRSVGVAGTVNEVSGRFPSDRSFIDDMADGMRDYQVINPALTK